MSQSCGISITPVRKEASDRAEMVSQLLFGETFTILDEFKDWRFIEIVPDGYRGWIDARTVLEVSNDAPILFLDESLMIALKNDASILSLSYGSELNVDNSNEINSITGRFQLPETIINRSGSKPEGFDKIVQDALLFLNVPYLWGGRSAFGLDCSGMVQIVHKVNGIKLPRDASEQSKMGIDVSFEDRQKGDMAYFQNAEGKITHVGLLLNREEILHASGWVRIDKFTGEGIFTNTDNRKSHQLAFIKRLSYTA